MSVQASHVGFFFQCRLSDTHNALTKGYKYNYKNKSTLDSYRHLSEFPTNLEITHELSIAESQALNLASFVGIEGHVALQPQINLNLESTEENEGMLSFFKH